MADREVILPLLLMLLLADGAAACWLLCLLLRRLAPPVAHGAAHLVHVAPGRAAAWLLIAEIAAGPVDTHPGSYAARALPLYSDRTTTPGGPR